MTTELWTRGYQDAMQGVEPTSDDPDYLDGYHTAPDDRESGFTEFTTDYPDLR